MSRLKLMSTFLRELVSPRMLDRVPEPELMVDPDQVRSYADAGRTDGPMAAAYLFHSARVSQVIAGCRNVLDLGCGPATQLAQIAHLNPDHQFIGVDLSSTMLNDAGQHLRKSGVENVDLRQGSITKLDFIADHSMDAVISTMTLHHLPSRQLLCDCFAEIARVLKPGGAVYLTDFGRLKSVKSVEFFAYRNADNQPHLFTLDTKHSLLAAFLKGDFEELATQYLPADVRVVSTFLVPFLVIVKTDDKPLQPHVLRRLRELRTGLAPHFRRDLDDICTFFAAGGLRNDPFRPSEWAKT